MHRCDGETCVFSRNEKSQAITTPMPCCKPRCNCKQVGRLSVIIPQLARLAYVTVETHSVWDIISLAENLQAAQVLDAAFPSSSPVASVRSAPPTGDGGRARRKKSLLFIEPDPSWVQRQLEVMRVAALPQVDQPLLTVTPRLLVDKQTGEIMAGATAWTGEDEDDEDDEPDDPFADAPAPPQPQPTVSPKPPQGPPPGDPPAKQPNPIASGTLARLTALGVSMYGEQWSVKEQAIAQAASTGAANKLAELTHKEG